MSQRLKKTEMLEWFTCARRVHKFDRRDLYVQKVALSGARGYKLIRVAVIYREGQLATEKSKE